MFLASGNCLTWSFYGDKKGAPQLSGHQLSCSAIMELRLLAIVCLVGAAFAGPLQRDTGSRCSTECPQQRNQKFNYSPGQKYVYSYTGVNYIEVAGSSKEQKADISGTAEIHVTDQCEMTLRLQNIRMQQNTPDQEIQSLIEKLETPLPFAFVDGAIERICGGSEESQVSLNIKRGVLSAFINTMSHLEKPEEVKEVDSLGTCTTKYTVRHLRDGYAIRKVKNLRSCNNRHTAVTAFITNPYDSPNSKYHNLPLLSEEEVVCEQLIQDNVVKTVKCTERAKIQPLKDQKNLIEFKGELEIELTEVKAASPLPIPSQTSAQSILYSYGDETSEETKEEEVEEILSELCSKAGGVVQSTVSKNFFKLIKAVRSMKYSSLERIYNSFKNGKPCDSKKIQDLLLDSLTMAGSEPAIKLMVKLYKQKEISGFKAKIWPASLALIPQPSEQTLAAVTPLLAEEENSAPILLGVSAMIYRYCSHHRCEQIPAVQEIVASLHQTLGSQCSSDNENEVVSILKAFGNMGHLGEAQETILECAKSTEKPLRVRLAAIDAFRRNQQERPSEMMELYSNPEENFEVRIAALSSAMQNATRNQIETVKEVMRREQNKQVAAYTSSLIANLKKTTCPLKKDMRNLLQDVEIETPDVGYWENSKNIELATYNEPINVGAGIESDIVHANESKIPRSIYTRFDAVLFGKHVNLLEVGVRAEGLEAAVKKLLGMEQQQANKKQSWSLLRSKNEMEQSKSEASLFLRTLNTEFLDLSVSDLTSVGKMVQVADIINKLAQGESVDFSHSFLFMDSKLYIPSVTGRSYAFGMTGSATVGLTASTKFDIVNLSSVPRNGDIEGRFQPSANVELTATVGIHSEKPRPDLRIVTNMHSESDIQAQFLVKDSHVALARITMPSENVTLVKISTDIIEIDSNQAEKRVVEDMQQKVNHCITTFEKSLGIAVCGKLEVPRPFLSKTFPFVRGVGNLELSLKKTDPQMQGYEMSLEIPKHQSKLMQYKLAIDTPGSKTPRRFAADLEVRSPQNDKREFQLEIQSPFKNASASAHYILRQDLAQGALELHSSSSRRYSLKASTEIQSSSSQKVFKPSFELTLPQGQPIKVSGTVSYSKGRKQQISFDLKSNQPSRKPLSVSGTLAKDGQISLSKNSEWKFSSDISVKSPQLDAQLRSQTEKQATQSQTISTTFTVDYQKQRSQKQSVKFSATAQKSQSKLSSRAEFETTQKPSLNWVLSWNMQGKLREVVKNDITLKYGRNQERNFINVLQTSKHVQDGLSECKISLKAPQFNVDSELRVGADINLKQNPKFHVEADLRYKEDQHAKAQLQLHHVSRKPLKMKVKAELEYPGRQLMYKDELEEVSPGAYEGNSIVQWQEGKRASLKYKYQKLSDRSKLHHEVESTLRLPSSSTPYSSKASVRMTRDSLDVQARYRFSRRPEYFLEAQLNKKGPSHVSVKLPKIEGNLKVVRELEKKAVDVDMKLNFVRPRHVIMSAGLEQGEKKTIQAEIQWDADQNPQQKVSAFTQIQITPKRSGRSYISLTKFQMLDIARFEFSGSGDASLIGQQSFALDLSGKRIQPLRITARHEMTSEQVKTSLSYSKSQSQKLQAELQGELKKQQNQVQFSARCSLQSPDGSFEEKQLSMNHQFQRSRSSTTLKSEVKVQRAPGQVYETEIDISQQQQSLELKAQLQTPHAKFQKQSVSISHRNSNGVLSSSAQIELSDEKQITVSSIIKKKKQGLTASCTVSTPFQQLSDAKFHISIDNQRSKKSLNSYIDINSHRQAETDLKWSSTPRSSELQGSFKSSLAPEISAHMKTEKSSDSILYQAAVMQGQSTLFSSKLAKESSRQDVTYSLETTAQDKPLLNLQLAKESTEESEKHSLKAESSSFPTISIALKSTKNDKNSRTLSLTACREQNQRQCYEMKGYYKGLRNAENYQHYKKVTFVVDRISGNSSPKHLCNVHFLLAAGGNDYRSKLILEAREKTLGYEARLHRKEHDDEPCHMDMHVFLPSRTVRVSSSALHNSQQVLVDFEIQPDAAVPSRKISAEFKNQHSHRSNEVSGYLKLSHPKLEKPIQVTYQMQKEGKWPVGGKMEIDYSRSDKGTVTIELIQERGQRQGERRAATYKLYSQDKSMDIQLQVMKQQSREQDLYGYSWSWQSSKGQKSGGFQIKLSEKRSGKPSALEIAYNTPTVDLKVIGRTAWAQGIPSEVTLKILSQNEEIYDITYTKEQSCAQIEVRRSGPFLRSKMCVNQVQSDKMQILSLESHYREHQCFNLNIDLDPEQAHIANIAVQWEKEYFRQALREMNDITSILNDSALMEIEQEISEKIQRASRRLRQDVLKPLAQSIKSQYRQQSQQMKQQLMELKESTKEYLQYAIPALKRFEEYIWRPVVEQFECMTEKAVRFSRDHFPEALRFMWNLFREEMEECMKKYCSRGTFCYQLKRTYQRQGMKQAQQLIHQKLRDMQRSYSQQLLKAIDWMPNFRRYLAKEYESLKEFIRSLWRPVLNSQPARSIRQTLEQLEDKLRQKFERFQKQAEQKIREWIEKAEQDSDFRVLKSIMQDCKQKALKAWQQRESLVQQAWKPIKNSVFEEYPRNWIRQRIDIERFSIKEGTVKVQLHHPFDRSNLQVLNNTLLAIKNKIMSSQRS